jgi:hypothetical protein
MKMSTNPGKTQSKRELETSETEVHTYDPEESAFVDKTSHTLTPWTMTQRLVDENSVLGRL